MKIQNKPQPRNSFNLCSFKVTILIIKVAEVHA
jgi:hypothetical protein